MQGTLRRASLILHRVFHRTSGDETVLSIDDEGGVVLDAARFHREATLHASAFTRFVERLEQYNYKRVAGIYGDAMADFYHDLEVHEGPGKKGRCTMRFNFEYEGWTGDAPRGLREIVTLLDRLLRFMRDKPDFDGFRDEGFLDELGRGIEFPYINPHGEPGEMTLIDVKGQVLKACERRWSMPFGDGLMPFRDADEQYGFMRPNGEIVITPRFQLTYGFSEGLAPVKSAGGWGYIDVAGRAIIPPQFVAAGAFAGGMAAVTRGQEDGFITRDGSFLAAPSGATEFGPFSEGRARFRGRNRLGEMAWGFIDERCQVVLKPTYTAVGDFSEGRAWVCDEELYGYVGRDGSLDLECRYDRADDFHGGLAVALAEGRAGFIGTDGGWAIDPAYINAKRFSEGAAPVRAGRRYGYLSPQGVMLIEPRFEEAEPFSDGLAAVRVDHRWGYIDRSGALVIEPSYESAWPFVGGVACVRQFAAQKPVVHTGSRKVIVNL
ncbi:MAG: WG repeat-containing protein [Nannocystaceae bacterium]|nr:WG repeat-containing protein [Myxococcales bacterium]